MNEKEVNAMTAEQLASAGFVVDPVVRKTKTGTMYTWVSDQNGNMFHYWFTNDKKSNEFIGEFYSAFGVEPVFDSEEEEEKGEGKKDNKVEDYNNSMDSEQDEEPQIVSVLREILETTTGIQPKITSQILRRVSYDPDFYEKNPMYLMKVLMNGGLSWVKARDVLDQLYGLLYKDRQEENPWFMAYPVGSGSAEMMQPMLSYPYQYPKYREEDPDAQLDKRMNRMLMNMMMINMIKSMSPPQQITPTANAIVEYEPVLDKDGNPVTDANGQVVMKQRVIPVQVNQTQSSKEVFEFAKELVESMKGDGGDRSDIVEKLTEKLLGMQDTVMNVIRDMTQSQISDLKERLSAMESSDPLEQIKMIIDTLKDMGIVSGPRQETLDEVKLKLDFEKWKHEQDMELKRWLEDQRMKLEDKKYAREQLKAFTKATSEAISKVAVPIAQGMGAGYREGLKARMKEAPQPPPQPQAQAQPPPSSYSKPINELANEDLVKLLTQAEQSEAKVNEVKKQIMAEITRRGIKI